MDEIAMDIWDAFFSHSGVKHKSGRYKFGTGETPYQHEPWFTWGKNEWLNEYRDLADKGYTKTEIAEKMGLSASELKTRYSNAINDERIQLISANEKLTADGYNRSERARMMGVNESTIRSLENKKSQEKTERARRTA